MNNEEGGLFINRKGFASINVQVIFITVVSVDFLRYTGGDILSPGTAGCGGFKLLEDLPQILPAQRHSVDIAICGYQ
jgi:hypothetical protein